MSPTPAGVPTDEGTILFVVGADTFSTWYKVVGTLSGRTKRPLVVLHGGPGLTHDYLIPLADLAVDRPVIFYDQIGNGQSSRAADKPQAFWTFDLMIDELVNLLGHFKIEDDFDIIGHSWGSQLLPEYILRRSPTGLKHAVFTNPLCDEPAYLNTRMEQLKEFPQWVQDAMMKQDHPDHRKAIEEYASVHFCRVKPMPEAFTRSINYGLEDGHVWEHFIAGELRDWVVTDQLHKINVPSLVINGRFDASQDVVVAPYFWRIPHAKWVRFEECSHTPFWEERERYMRLVGDFLEY